MVTIDWTKLVTLLLVVAGAIFLTYTGHLESEACVALLGAALGYVFGNGHGVAESRQAAARMAAAVDRLEHDMSRPAGVVND